jgi:hypothetical protein
MQTLQRMYIAAVILVVLVLLIGCQHHRQAAPQSADIGYTFERTSSRNTPAAKASTTVVRGHEVTRITSSMSRRMRAFVND